MSERDRSQELPDELAMGGNRRRGGDRRSPAPLTWRHRFGTVSRLGAYVLVVIVAAIGFRADRYQSYRLCEVGRTNTVILRTLVNRTSTLEAPPGSDPQLVELLERARLENERFREEANRLLTIHDCHRPWP